MLAEGFATRRGPARRLVHYDAVNGRIRGRRGARLLAITSGGAIPDTADYRVILEPEGTFLGTVNEDFAVESIAGDIFQLGNLSWRILRVQQGTVRVEDAHGQPPGIPFWLGEAPARSNELSAAVSELRREVEERLDDPAQAIEWVAVGTRERKRTVNPSGPPSSWSTTSASRSACSARFPPRTPSSPSGSSTSRAACSSSSTRRSAAGSTAPGGWRSGSGSAASSTSSCRPRPPKTRSSSRSGPQHSFPLDTVFRFLQPETVEDILVQALLDAPMFGTHWRWNATIALAIPRSRGGRRLPPQLQRMQAEDLLAAAFPDAAACLENIPGDREIPDHPLVRQTVSTTACTR